MCAGREGDDGYVHVEPNNPIFNDLLDVVMRSYVELYPEGPDGVPAPGAPPRPREDDVVTDSKLETT